MIITRKQLLIQKYKELLEKLEPSIFPQLYEYDLTDILYFISLTFPQNSNYKNCFIDC